MRATRDRVVIRSQLVAGPATLVAILMLVVAGAVLFVVHKDRPRDLTGYPYLLIPLVGVTLLTRANLGAGLTAAVLSLALGFVLGATTAVITAIAALA
jgi:hypothetical protein